TAFEIERTFDIADEALLERALSAEAEDVFVDESPSSIAIRYYLVNERYDEARALLDDIRERVEATGEGALMTLWYYECEFHRRRNAWSQAINLADNGLELVESTARDSMREHFLSARAWAKAHTGDVDGCRADAAELREGSIMIATTSGALALGELSVLDYAAAERAASVSL